MKRLIAILVLAFAVGVQAETLNISELPKAACRIDADKGLGSGTVFSQSKDKKHYYILTCAHVVGESKNVKVDFFDNGHHKIRVPGVVSWKGLSNNRSDFAIVKINVKDLKGHKPLVIPLAPKGVKVKATADIMSVGLPHGRWPMSFTGFVSHISKEETLAFTPAPFQGQSGSAILIELDDPKKKGERKTYIGGIVARVTRVVKVTPNGMLEGHGIAIQINNLHKLLSK